MLVPIPIVCFLVATLVTDIVYSQTRLRHAVGQHFEAWALVVGILFTVLAAIAGLIDFVFNDPRILQRCAPLGF